MWSVLWRKKMHLSPKWSEQNILVLQHERSLYTLNPPFNLTPPLIHTLLLIYNRESMPVQLWRFFFDPKPTWRFLPWTVFDSSCKHLWETTVHGQTTFTWDRIFLLPKYQLCTKSAGSLNSFSLNAYSTNLLQNSMPCVPHGFKSDFSINIELICCVSFHPKG